MSPGQTPPANAGPRLRIGVVVPKYGLVGGGERFAAEITERLARNPRFDIHVFANRWVAASDRVSFHWIPIVRFPRFLGPLVFAWVTRWKLRRAKVDLVHSHHWIWHADIFSAHGVPHSGWTRNVRRKLPSLYDRAVIAIERSLMKGGQDSHFLPVSSIAMAAFEKEYSPLPGHWQMLHPGVDIARFATPDRAACRQEIRARYGIAPDALLLLFVGMNFEVKGLDVIIAALAKAKALRPDADIRLLVVGRGNQRKFAGIAAQHGVADAVIFAGPQHAGLERYYRAADVFTMFSVFDTFGLVVLEAMAAGIPVIVSPNVGAQDLVQQGVNGFVLPRSDDSAAGGEYIAQMLDAQRRQIMGAAAELEAAKHAWDRLAATTEVLYMNILTSRSLA